MCYQQPGHAFLECVYSLFFFLIEHTHTYAKNKRQRDVLIGLDSIQPSYCISFMKGILRRRPIRLPLSETLSTILSALLRIRPFIEAVIVMTAFTFQLRNSVSCCLMQVGPEWLITRRVVNLSSISRGKTIVRNFGITMLRIVVQLLPE